MPRDASTLEIVVAEIGQRPRGTELLVAGNFNTDMELPDRLKRNELIAKAIATEGLEDMTKRFLPHKLPCTKDSRTWIMIRRGQEVGSQTATFWNRRQSIPRM